VKRLRPFVLLAVVLAALLPAAAGAATVRVGQAPSPPANWDWHGSYSSKAVYYAAAPGERNDLTVSAMLNAERYVEVVVHDDGAPVTAGVGCVRLDDRTARCGGRPDVITVAQAALGNRDDRLRVDLADPLHTLEAVRAFGGAGADVLVGGASSDELYGGGGRDALIGRDGHDVIGDGDAGARADTMDGGKATTSSPTEAGAPR
jgi:Ca2+-binding RTX toxin-like protein